MLRIRSLAEFVPDDNEVDEVLRDLWAVGESRPEWCFVGERDGRVVARLGFAAAPVADAVPQLEHRVVGAWVPAWDESGVTDLRDLLAQSLPSMRPAPISVDFRFNAESVGDQVAARRAFAESAGFALFQEKVGLLWPMLVNPCQRWNA